MTRPDPHLIPKDALDGITVGISVSDSADLHRLGLTDRHLELAVGEITRAVLIAGGMVMYGGRLQPSGFTQQLMNEVQRFATTRHALTLCVALPEHIQMDNHELQKIDASLGTAGRLITLDGDGNPIRWQERSQPQHPLTDEQRIAAYSGLRRYMAGATTGRIVIGGQLRNYKGAMPGVIEEVLFSIESDQPVYLAGGFGGAAAAIARRLDAGSFEWFPEALPAGATDALVQEALDQLAAAATTRGWTVGADGLTSERRKLLWASHRPGEVASLAVLGLAAQTGAGPQKAD